MPKQNYRIPAASDRRSLVGRHIVAGDHGDRDLAAVLERRGVSMEEGLTVLTDNQGRTLDNSRIRMISFISDHGVVGWSRADRFAVRHDMTDREAETAGALRDYFSFNADNYKGDLVGCLVTAEINERDDFELLYARKGLSVDEVFFVTEDSGEDAEIRTIRFQNFQGIEGFAPPAGFTCSRVN